MPSNVFSISGRRDRWVRGVRARFSSFFSLLPLSSSFSLDIWPGQPSADRSVGGSSRTRFGSSSAMTLVELYTKVYNLRHRAGTLLNSSFIFPLTGLATKTPRFLRRRPAQSRIYPAYTWLKFRTSSMPIGHAGNKAQACHQQIRLIDISHRA